MDNAQYVEVMTWLQIIGNNSTKMREIAEGRAGASSAGGGSNKKEDPSMLDRLGTRIQNAVKSGMQIGLGQAKSLANRGFAGTTEQAQNNYAMEMLGRQFASVMKPVMDAMTYGAVEIQNRMRGMNGSEQNRLMGGIIGAGIGMRYGGGMGALAGGVIGMGAFSDGRDMSTGERGLHAASSAYLGFRVAGPYGAGTAAAGSVISTSGDYSRMREAGKSRIASAAVSVAAGIYELPHDIFGTGAGPLDEARKKWDAKRRAEATAARRDVTPFQAEMMEAGGTAASVQTAIIRATAGPGFEESGPFKPLVDLGLLILDQIIKLNGGTPPPRSATV